MQSYDYANRQGVRPISWEDFVNLTAKLAEAIEPTGVEIIVGIARAGLLPATLLACSLRREMYPVRLTRRVNDIVTYNTPVWKVPVSTEVAGKKVVIVDEIADSGETLALVAQKVRESGASEVFTATLVSHSWANPTPDFSGLVSDELIIFPWDAQVYSQGQWQPHPEIVAALKLQQPE
jgi:uncharacterized protein